MKFFFRFYKNIEAKIRIVINVYHQQKEKKIALTVEWTTLPTLFLPSPLMKHLVIQDRTKITQGHGTPMHKTESSIELVPIQLIGEK